MEFNPFNFYTEEYEDWFKEHPVLFQSELLALKQMVPPDMKGIEIGIGSGIFAEKLGIKHGIDPSEKMLEYARKRRLIVEKAYAEDLPCKDESYEFAVFITSICFIKDPQRALKEANRILKFKGVLIVAFIDRDSTLGQSLEAEKEDSKFYRHARFYSVSEIISMIETNGFMVTDIVQTLMDMNSQTPEIPIKGYGRGGFVVIRGSKNKNIPAN